MSSVERPAPKQRPVYLNLARIRLPLPGLVSILHRISGAALFLVGVPLLLYAVQASLASPERFESLRAFFAAPLVQESLDSCALAHAALARHEHHDQLTEQRPLVCSASV